MRLEGRVGGAVGSFAPARGRLERLPNESGSSPQAPSPAWWRALGAMIFFIGMGFGAGVGGGFRRRGAGLAERGRGVWILLKGLIQPASPWILRAGGILTDPVQARGGTFMKKL